MAYEKHTWQSNELVTAEKLNHIEQGISQSGGARWDVTIQSSDWTLQDDLYVYSVTLSGISEASWVDVNAHGYEQYFSTPINWEVITGDIITFSTTMLPTGDIEIGVGVWGGSESEQHSGVLEAVPIYLGGTGAKTAADARINLEITPANIGAIASSEKGANNGIAELDANGKVLSSQLPSYVDDVLEYNAKASFPATGEAGKIYVDTSTNLTYRWSGSDYVEISQSLALGTTSSTAFRGDYGNAAYAHAVTNKGAAFSSGLYKITTNSEGHVTAATAVVKADITGLGIPGSDTNTHRPIQVNGTEILGNNTTTLNLKAGSNVTLTNSSGTVTVAATDTTYSSKSAASGGTAVSLVTTGEKYTWNNKSNLAIGTTATTAAAGNHTHTLSLAANSGTSKISLAANTKYQLTAGGSTYIFTTPPDANTTYSAGTGLSLSGTTFSISAKAARNAMGLGNTTGALPIANGGTGATSAYDARANLLLNDIGTILSHKIDGSSIVTNGTLTTLTIAKDCWVCFSFHVVASSNGLAVISRNDIAIVNDYQTGGACNFWVNVAFPYKAGGKLQYKLNTNAADSQIVFVTKE